MSESNGKQEPRRFKKRRSVPIIIEDELGNDIKLVLKQMMGDDLTTFEKFRKGLTTEEGVPIDAAAGVAVTDKALSLMLFDAGTNGLVSREFINELSVDTKNELMKEVLALNGNTVAAREAAKNG